MDPFVVQVFTCRLGAKSATLPSVKVANGREQAWLALGWAVLRRAGTLVVLEWRGGGSPEKPRGAP